MRQLLPTRARVGLERLEQVLQDVSIALTRPKRPPSSTRQTIPRPASDPPIEKVAAKAPATSQTSSDPPQADTADEVRHRVVFEHLGEEVLVGPDQSILDAGREAGLDLDFSCTVGGCAACALQIVEGDVVYDIPTCLSDEEIDAGLCLACVGRPDGELVLTSRY